MGLRRTEITVIAVAQELDEFDDPVPGTGEGEATTIAAIDGTVRAVHLAYSEDAEEDMTVTIAEANNSPAMPILQVVESATSGWYFPLALATRLLDHGVPVVVGDHVTLTVEGANHDDEVTATIIWEEA